MSLTELVLEAMKWLALVTVAVPAVFYWGPEMVRQATSRPADQFLLMVFWLVIAPLVAFGVYLFKLIELGSLYEGVSMWSQNFDGIFLVPVALGGLYGLYRVMHTAERLGRKLDEISGTAGYAKIDAIIAFICGVGVVLGTAKTAKTIWRKL